jgi:hypothetical protein
MAKKKRTTKGKTMAKTPLNKAAASIGTTLGKATMAARALGEASPKTKKEFAQLKKSLGALVRELERATKRARKALR